MLPAEAGALRRTSTSAGCPALCARRLARPCVCPVCSVSGLALRVSWSHAFYLAIRPGYPCCVQADRPEGPQRRSRARIRTAGCSAHGRYDLNFTTSTSPDPLLTYFILYF